MRASQGGSNSGEVSEPGREQVMGGERTREGVSQGR